MMLPSQQPMTIFITNVQPRTDDQTAKWEFNTHFNINPRECNTFYSALQMFGGFFVVSFYILKPTARLTYLDCWRCDLASQKAINICKEYYL